MMQKKERLFLKDAAAAGRERFGDSGAFFDSGAESGVRIGELCELWRQSIRYQVKPSTFACYSTIIQKHIWPAIGELSLKQLDNERLLSFIREKQGQKLAVSTLRLILFLLKSVLRFGEEHGCFAAEPLCFFMPRSRGNAMRLLSRENQEALLHRLAAARTNFELGLLLSCTTGIRVGELCGLKWGDMDFEAGILSVRRTVSRIRNVGDVPVGYERVFLTQDPRPKKEARTILCVGSPKTGTSVRDIPLPDFIAAKLKERRREDDAFLLTGTGKCMEPRGVQRRFKNLLRKSGIPQVNIHSLRHSFASMWIENGFDSKALSEILGHSSVKITMDIYVHSNMNQKKVYINQMMENMDYQAPF